MKSLLTSLLLLPLLLLSGVRPAQAQPVTSYTVNIFLQGAGLPLTTATLPASSFLCSQTPKVPPATGSVANPGRFVVDDPAAPSTADCIYVDPGTGPILALPFGTQVFTATIAATSTGGTSVATAGLNSFTHPGASPSAPTGFRIIK